jgi:hypothetical protein
VAETLEREVFVPMQLPPSSDELMDIS